MQLDGLHHVAAITADRAACADFYGLLLGLDPVESGTSEGASIAFGDRHGSPGGVISFLEVPGAPAGEPGRGFAHRVEWRLGGAAALEFWQRRLDLAGVAAEVIEDRDGWAELRFRDPEGLEHALVVERGEGGPALVAESTGIPWEMRIRGLAGARAYVPGSVESSDLLAGRLGFEALPTGDWRVGGQLRPARYGSDAPPDVRPVQGAGTVHHLAWSCRPGDERAWRQRVIGMGATVSPVVECGPFRSFCFREPDGVLFSIATRGGAAPAGSGGFGLLHPAQLPARIARPIGLLAAI